MKVHYVYHDYPDSALNFKFFLDNFSLENVESIDVSACSFEYFDESLIPKNIKINIVEDDVDMFLHYKWLDSQVAPFSDVLLLNSSCIGPLNNTISGAGFLDAITSLLGVYALVAPIIEVPPDNHGTKSIENYLHICEDDYCVPFAHSYCLFISSLGVSVIKESGVLNKSYLGKEQAIFVCERQLTAVLLNAKLPIFSLLRMHRNVDFVDKRNWDFSIFSKDEGVTCPEVPGNYFGANIDPYEVVFYKNIRHSGKFRPEDRSGIPFDHGQYIEKILLHNFDQF